MDEQYNRKPNARFNLRCFNLQTQEEIYFDNAATTKVADYAIEAALNAMQKSFGNPSSLHKKGIKAKNIIEEARQAVSDLVGCKPSEVYFTSGASESNIIAILGALLPKPRKTNKIITSSIEHKSVLNCFKTAESLGYIVQYIKPKNNQIIAEELKGMVDSNTALVSIMHVNNETGGVNNIKKLADAVKLKNPKTLFHCDACQSMGKLSIFLPKLNIDMLSFSGHKLHAPKGIGGLYLKKGVKACLVCGGTQEYGVRMGTENVPGIAAFGAVCKKLNNTIIQENWQKINELKNKLVDYLITEFKDDITINSPGDASPYILNFSVLGLPAQVLQNCLQGYGILVSTGSACSKNAKSYVLKELEFSNEIINSAVRVSFCSKNTVEEVERFVKVLKDVVGSLKELNARGGKNQEHNRI